MGRISVDIRCWNNDHYCQQEYGQPMPESGSTTHLRRISTLDAVPDGCRRFGLIPLQFLPDKFIHMFHLVSSSSISG
jgi:hypothetical protein